MKVLIDTSVLSNQNNERGVGRYTRELLFALRRLPTGDVFYSSSDQLTEKVDLVHYPYFDLFSLTLPLRKTSPTIVTIHDVTPLILAKHYPPGIRGTIKFFIQKQSLRSVSHVITDSEISKRDIIEKLGIATEKVSVVPLAAAAQIKRPQQSIIDSVRKKHELPKYFALYVGDINYNKNLPFLINSMRLVPKLSLVLVGRNMKNTSIPEGKAIENSIIRSGMTRRIRLITDIGVRNTEELSAIYSAASVYVQPSLYEGFGLPVLEAMQCKTPVVCSLGGSLPEIAGDGALYFHPHDEGECAAAITKILQCTPKQHVALVQAGAARAALYSWERTAKETYAIYDRIHSNTEKR